MLCEIPQIDPALSASVDPAQNPHLSVLDQHFAVFPTVESATMLNPEAEFYRLLLAYNETVQPFRVSTSTAMPP